MPTKTMTASLLFVLALFVSTAHGNDLNVAFAELDASLCARSPKYKEMADAIRQRHTYRIEAATEFPLGNVRGDGSGLVIELNPKLPVERRATILIWEMANAYQRETFDEIGRKARAGEISSSREYGIRMELVEHGSHQLHRDVLEDLSRAGVRIAQDYLFFLNPDLKSLDEYRVPSAHAYIEAQSKSGHTEHYETWYYRVTGTPPR